MQSVLLELPEPAVYLVLVAIIAWYFPAWVERVVASLRVIQDYRRNRR